jgi:hypothetical protein
MKKSLTSVIALYNFLKLKKNHVDIKKESKLNNDKIFETEKDQIIESDIVKIEKYQNNCK